MKTIKLGNLTLFWVVNLILAAVILSINPPHFSSATGKPVAFLIGYAIGAEYRQLLIIAGIAILTWLLIYKVRR